MICDIHLCFSSVNTELVARCRWIVVKRHTVKKPAYVIHVYTADPEVIKNKKRGKDKKNNLSGLFSGNCWPFWSS